MVNNMYAACKTRRGVTAVEMLVGVSIAALILIAASTTISTFANTAHNIVTKTQALYLTEDGLELVRFVRDNDWADINSLTEGDTYYIDVDASSVEVGSTPETVGEFTRSVVFENVYRHSSTDDVVASTSPSSVEDTNSKYVTVTVSWGSPVESVSLPSILADITP
jgi:competence protein ComGC